MRGSPCTEIEPGIYREEPHPFYYPESWDVIAEWMPQREKLVIVELGTWLGAWAREVLDRFDPWRLFCVDMWGIKPKRTGRGYIPPEGWKEIEPGMIQDNELSKKFYQSWARRMGDNLWRNVFPLKGFTAEWGALFSDEIDFLYIDATHRTPHVRQDIALWVPKIRPGGVVLGHDYNLRHVSRAVRLAPELRGKDVQIFKFGPKKGSRSFMCKV